jgi:hypothetical protein
MDKRRLLGSVIALIVTAVLALSAFAGTVYTNR